MQPPNTPLYSGTPDIHDVRRLCKITFTVRASLRPEQHVRVLGNASSLGWDYDKGLQLFSSGPDGASSPEWIGYVGLPTHSALEYKYVVCDTVGFCYSLSPIRRLFIKKEGIDVNDGEFLSHMKYERIQKEDFANQLKIQLEVPPNFTTPAGQQALGITLYDTQTKPTTVNVSTRDTLGKVVESRVLANEFHEVATFQFRRSGDVKSLHFAVKITGERSGFAVVLTSQLASSHHGVIAAPLLDSSFEVIGEVVFRYLVVTPFSHPHIAHTAVPQSRLAMPVAHNSSTLLIGHRGTGAEGSRAVVDGKVRSHIKENTVLSFTTAGSLGAQLVEFDVHLTSDLVPVIYHDFTTHLGESEMPIHSMTYEKFCKMGKRDVSRSTSLEDLKHNSVLNAPIHDMFPTLRQTLQRVPKKVGFNVEIKYPVADEIEKYNLRPVNRNVYLDCILWEIYEHAKDRFIVFSSFDPEICLMLAAKQPHYPVFFLTQLGTVIRSDPRSNSPEASIDFALSAGLGGLVCPARHLIENPSVITQIKNSGLKVCTWGSDNNNPLNVHFQKKAGVDGVIVDHVAHIAKHWEVK